MNAEVDVIFVVDPNRKQAVNRNRRRNASGPEVSCRSTE
jgi:hypothetical protein